MKKFNVLVMVLVSFLMVGRIMGFTGNSDQQQDLKQAKILLKKGISGDKEAIDQVCEGLEKYLSDHPNSAMANVLLGSAYTIRARDVKMPWSKMKWSKKGLALMDKAVKMDSTNLFVRFERAMNNMHLPSFFNRHSVAESDFNFIVRFIEQQPDSLIAKMEGKEIYPLPQNPESAFLTSAKQMFYFYAATFFENNQDTAKAKKLLNKVLRLSEQGYFAGLAKERLGAHK